MKRPITISDMTTRATNSAELEMIRRTGDLLVSTFELVTGESIEPESDRDKLADLVCMHESE